MDKSVQERMFGSVFYCLKNFVGGLRPDERVELIRYVNHALFSDFCSDCGEWVNNKISGCQCRNDE